MSSAQTDLATPLAIQTAEAGNAPGWVLSHTVLACVYLCSVAGRAACVPGAALDAETAETRSARSGLHRAGDAAGDVQDSDGRM